MSRARRALAGCLVASVVAVLVGAAGRACAALVGLVGVSGETVRVDPAIRAWDAGRRVDARVRDR